MAYTNEALGKALEDLTKAYDNFIKNTKDQVIQSLGQDVLNEIKEETKSYVSSEEKKEVSKRFINLYKNGYVQWPGMPSPLEDTSLHFEGYSWYEVNYDGNFFRAKGRNAKPFSSTRLSMEQIKSGAYAFEADEQGDAMREIEGTFGSDDSHFSYLSGAFKPKAHIRDLTTEPDEIDGWLIQFKSSYQSPVAEENRSRNLTFIIWALVKDE